MPAALFAVGADVGGPPEVKVYDDGGQLVRSVTAYDPAFRGGVRAAVGDVTGDGVADLVTAAGVGGGPHVKVFDGATGGEVGGFYAYHAGFIGGVTVAVGDVTGDGVAEIVTGVGAGGGPHVRVFTPAGAVVSEFFAFDPAFTGGVNVAAGDTDGDGRAEVVTAAGAGGGPHIKVFAADGRTTASFYAYHAGFAGGVNVGVGDVTGDGRAEVVTGAGTGGGPHVKVFTGGGVETRGFFAHAPNSTYGVPLAVTTAGASGKAAIAVGNGPGGSATVKLFRGDGSQFDSVAAFGSTFAEGVTFGNGSGFSRSYSDVQAEVRRVERLLAQRRQTAPANYQAAIDALKIDLSFLRFINPFAPGLSWL